MNDKKTDQLNSVVDKIVDMITLLKDYPEKYKEIIKVYTEDIDNEIRKLRED